MAMGIHVILISEYYYDFVPLEHIQDIPTCPIVDLGIFCIKLGLIGYFIVILNIL